MEFSNSLSQQAFKGVHLALIANNRKYRLLHTISCIFLLLWLLIPFLQIFAVGIHNHATLSEVFFAYLSFFVGEGWLSAYFLILCAFCFFSAPRVRAFFSFKKHYRQFQMYTGKKIVLSDWKICVYTPKNELIASFPYHEIQDILWDETVICLLLKSGIYFTLNCESIQDGHTVEEIAEYLELQKEMICTPTQPFSYSFAYPHAKTLWETTVPQNPHYLTQFYRLFYQYNRENKLNLFCWAFLFVIFSLLTVFGIVPLFSAVAAVLVGKNLLFLLVPPLYLRRIRRYFEKNSLAAQTLLFSCVRITENGIERGNGFYYSSFVWSNLTATVIGQDGLLILQNGSVVVFLPKELFESDAQFLHIGRTVQKQIEQAHLFQKAKMQQI